MVGVTGNDTSESLFIRIIDMHMLIVLYYCVTDINKGLNNKYLF